MKLTDLKGKHEGKTVYVVGSGSSLGFIDPLFFADKITITMNLVARVHKFTPTYLFSHYHNAMTDLLDEESVGVTLERDTVSHQVWQGHKPSNVVFFPHEYDYCRESSHGSCVNPHGENFDPFKHPPVENSLLYGSSSLHGAMDLAGYLGARFVVLVGADCGTIDGHHRIPNYPNDEPTETYARWVWGVYDNHHQRMKEWLQTTYGCDVYSLNPFINLNLEGHKFHGVEHP
jgi:hypothetical protein